jgi:hypothetical protein
MGRSKLEKANLQDLPISKGKQKVHDQYSSLTYQSSKGFEQSRRSVPSNKDFLQEQRMA